MLFGVGINFGIIMRNKITLILPLLLTLSVFAKASEQYVYPDTLKGKPSLELGQAVLLFMPPASQRNIDWNYLANSKNVSWVDNPFIERTNDDGSANGASRTGWIRVNVSGRNATVLKKNLFELGWMVSYENDSDARHYVDTITLMPGANDGDDQCFGRSNTGCTFDPRPSLKRAGIKYTLICENKNSSGGDQIFLLTAPNKKSTLADWSRSSGSGGATASFILNLTGNKQKMCEPDTN
ncbi:MAG: hypothetical protein ACHP65_09880 [Legionellales bacterium]